MVILSSSSVTFGSYWSTPAGHSSTGAVSNCRLPFPLIFTTSLPDSFAGKSAFCKWASIEKIPTEPLKETGLFISSDSGEHWKQQSATANITARPFYFSVIKVDPKDPKRVYRPAFTFAYSDDGGFSYNESGNDGGYAVSYTHLTLPTKRIV